MTEEQHSQLPENTYATHAEITITPLGYRLPFATNEAASGYANSQTLVQIATGVGIERHMPVYYTGYHNTDSDLTTVESFVPLSMRDAIWGTVTKTGQTFGGVTGIPRHWNRYAVLPQMLTSSLSGTRTSITLLKFIKLMNVNDVKGSALINYKYDFKNGMVKSNSKQDWNMVDTTQILNGVYDGPITKNAAPTGEYQKSSHWKIDNNYWMDIEKANTSSQIMGQKLSSTTPPLIYFGVYPVQSNAPMAASPTFSPVVVNWKVTTKLHLRSSTNFIYDDFIPLKPVSYTHLRAHET